MLEKNSGKVNIVFKHYPLKIHKFALQAAVAAEAAAKTGEFWVFHDALFENYRQLSNEKILDIAVDLGFDRGMFEKQMQDPALYRRIQSDINDGVQAGVQGVPKVFINGRALKERTFKGFQEMIDRELEKIETEKLAGEDAPQQ